MPAADRAAAWLRDAIARGDFPAGAWLPAERDLVEQIGVGRPAIREAIAALLHYNLWLNDLVDAQANRVISKFTRNEIKIIAADVAGKQPVEQRRMQVPDMHVAGGRRRKAYTDFVRHWVAPLRGGKARALYTERRESGRGNGRRSPSPLAVALRRSPLVGALP